MTFESKKAMLRLNEDEVKLLERTSKAKTKPIREVERAKILLLFFKGNNISEIARHLQTNRPKVERTINKALSFGIENALIDIKRPGKPRVITKDARTWVISIACNKPMEYGYNQEVWTTNLLSKHIQSHCKEAKHESLENIARGTISKILNENDIKPHKIKYFMEKRDPDFDKKMKEVLVFYKMVEISLMKGDEDYVYISFDEKPAIQAIGNKCKDKMPEIGKNSTIRRDNEYIRYGTLSLLAGMNLINGEIYSIVEEKHCSKEFIKFLEILNNQIPSDKKIKILMDNHSVHTSKETKKYLVKRPNRFEFNFTPKHASWVNTIERFFSTLARVLLKGIRVNSKTELKQRILGFINEFNQDPIPYRWYYRLNEV